MNPRAVTRLATRGRLLVCAALLSVTGVATETSPSIRPAIESYRSAIAAAEARAEPRGVESALAALRNLELLLHASVPGGRRSVLESLSEAEFAMVHQLPGVMVRREEILMVKPDPDFLVELSALVGDEADQRFAAALAAAHHYGRWHVYIQPQTDYGGCIDFEQGRLLETYLAWTAMERHFPNRYVSAVARERYAVVEAITKSNCACGDKASVVRELQRIARAVPPADSILDGVERQLAALDARSEFRFHCISG